MDAVNPDDAGLVQVHPASSCTAWMLIDFVDLGSFSPVALAITTQASRRFSYILSANHTAPFSRTANLHVAGPQPRRWPNAMVSVLHWFRVTAVPSHPVAKSIDDHKHVSTLASVTITCESSTVRAPLFQGLIHSSTVANIRKELQKHFDISSRRSTRFADTPMDILCLFELVQRGSWPKVC